jgi:hypothetical protein
MFLEPINLVPPITIHDISTFIGLKIPWRYDDDIVHAYPDPSLHFPSDSRQSRETIKASNEESLGAEHFVNCP